MKLISCHIENFGRLRNFDYEFSEGVNIICRENGWGKSTFSTFLRAMFYGIPGSRRKKTVDNERERYRPWQGGTYGGRLVFEVCGKRYEMTRVFGRKESEDEFELRDLGTGLLSADFSDKIGEELFHIDRDSFSRTVFTGQQDCSSGAADDVNALIADLTEHAGDMGNYETAMRRLTDAANRLTPKRAGGRMYRRSEEIRQLEREAASGEELAERLKICERKSREADGEEQAVNLKLQNLNLRIEEAANNEEKICRAMEMETYRAGSRKMRLRLSAARDQRKKEMERALDVFPGRVPARAEVEEYLVRCRELERLEARIQAGQLDEEEQSRLSELEDAFQDIPETDETDEADETEETDETEEIDETRGTEETWDMFPESVEKSMEKDRTRISGRASDRGRTGAVGAEKSAADGGPAAALSGSEKAGLSVPKRRKSASEEMSGSRGRAGGSTQIYIMCGIIGTALLAAGMTGAALTANHGFVLVIVMGALIVAAGAVSFYQYNEKKAASNPKPEHRVAEKKQAERREYEALRRKERMVEKYYADWSEARKPILHFLRELGYPPTDDLRARLEMLRDAADDCEDAGRLLREAESEIRSFDAEMRRKGVDPGPGNRESLLANREPFLAVSSVEPETVLDIDFGGNRPGASDREKSRAGDSGSLRRLAGETQEALLLCREKQAACRRELDELRAEHEEWENSMQRLGILRTQQEEDRNRYRRITAAASNLRAAKEGLTARYADPITGSFRRYWECITGRSAAGIHVDADSRVTVDERGRQRNTALLSAGYKDLAGICLRIALADAMYPTGRRERPPLIMDDPFCSLDDEKIEGAMYFLQEAGKSYQIIYFTCSSARC